MNTQKFAALKRRAALKIIGSSALFGGLADKLPGVWQRPIVQSAALSAHAQASPSLAQHLTLRIIDAGAEQASMQIRYSLHRVDGTITRLSIEANQAFARPPAVSDTLLPAAYPSAALDMRVRRPLVIGFGEQGIAKGDLLISLGDGENVTLTIEARLTGNDVKPVSIMAEADSVTGGIRISNRIMFPGSGFDNGRTENNLTVAPAKIVLATAGLQTVTTQAAAVVQRQLCAYSGGESLPIVRFAKVAYTCAEDSIHASVIIVDIEITPQVVISGGVQFEVSGSAASDGNYPRSESDNDDCPARDAFALDHGGNPFQFNPGATKQYIWLKPKSFSAGDQINLRLLPGQGYRIGDPGIAHVILTAPVFAAPALPIVQFAEAAYLYDENSNYYFDIVVEIEIQPATLIAGGVQFEVSGTADADGYRLVGGTSVPGGGPNIFQFNPGVTRQIILVYSNNLSFDEQLTLSLLASDGYRLGERSSTHVILTGPAPTTALPAACGGVVNCEV